MKKPKTILIGIQLLLGVTISNLSARGPVIDSLEVSAFFDGLIQAHLNDQHIAGATVALVQNGNLLFSKGYGFADLEKRVPVDPGRTLFRIGSVSKLFVWTAIMQLYEQGRLDLDADVNTYLSDFKIPATFSRPVSLRDIMTHSAGFEDRVIGLFARDSTQLEPLGAILARELPARIYPPGEVASYSNHATAMAAYIVEQVSGLSWDDYVEQNIFAPLGMKQTTFRQPLPARLQPDLSAGYRYSEGVFQPEAFEYIPLAPAGSVSTTATDIAKFMITHLQLGTYDDQRILDTATARLMHSDLFRMATGLNAMAYGFMGLNLNGQRIIGHGGDTGWFHTLLALFPEHGLGVFVSFNSEAGGTAYFKVFEEFVNHYFPAPPPSDEAFPAGDLKPFTGSYRSIRFPHKRLSRIVALAGTINVTASEEGRLQMPNLFGEMKSWIRIDSLRFREEHGSRHIAFRPDEEGRMAFLFWDELPFMAFERTPVAELPGLNLGLLGAGLLLVLSTLVAWPIVAYHRWHWDVAPSHAQQLPMPAKITGWLASLNFVIFFLGIAFALSEPFEIVYGLPTAVKSLLILPIAGLVLTIGVVYFTFRIWLKREGRINGRIYYTLLAFGLIAILWVLNNWNWIGFKY